MLGNEKNDKLVAEFKIFYHQFLDQNANVIQPFPDFATTDHLIQLYIAMIRTRAFDTKAITLQRTGKLGTYASTLGQEAIGVGLASAMEKTDVLFPYYRETSAQFMRGVRMLEILLYWGGDEQGSNFTHQPFDFPLCVPIASQTLHAAGAAAAFKLKKENKAVVTVLGDGATSRGDFYEAMNIAGVWQLPIVFVINNNQWAISVSRKNQTKAETLAQKAIAAGLKGVQVDGNDVIAVEAIMREALSKARLGEAQVVEAITYRLCDHTTADDAKRYREAEEVAKFQMSDPIARLYQYLCQKQAWNEEKDKALKLTIAEEVTNEIQEYLNIPKRKPSSMFDHLYATLPESYLPEKEILDHLEGNVHE